MPDPILIGRNAEKIEALAKAHGIARFGTNLDAALANKSDTVFFDAGTTQMRPTLLAQALRAGKHVYCEKPIATNLNEAVEICRLAQSLGPEARRGAGQAVPARPAQARHAAPRRLLRPHAGGAHRVRLLGVRGRPAADPAPELELPQGRRRRHDPRHDVPLALRAGQPVRRGAVDHLPRRHAHRQALGRSRQALRGHRRRRRLRHRAAQGPQRRAGGRAADDELGHARAARRPGHLPRRRHARLGGGRAAGMPRAEPRARRRARCGTPTSSRR